MWVEQKIRVRVRDSVSVSIIVDVSVMLGSQVGLRVATGLELALGLGRESTSSELYLSLATSMSSLGTHSKPNMSRTEKQG